jgi:hypothetical protein
MIERRAKNFRAMFGEKSPTAHLRVHAGAPGTVSREAVKARTSG